MKVAVIAVLLVVVYTFPPIPGKATDNQTGESAKHEHRTKNQQTQPTTHPSPESAPSPAPQGQSGSNPASPSNEEESIRVRELPSVSVNTDFWSKAPVILTAIYVVFTGVLVIVGIVGVSYARRSLLAIESQLIRMREQVVEM